MRRPCTPRWNKPRAILLQIVGVYPELLKLALDLVWLRIAGRMLVLWLLPFRISLVSALFMFEPVGSVARRA
jgi:hypothetical protein